MTRTFRVPTDRVALAAGAVVWALACTTALVGCGGHTTAPVHRPAGAAGSGPVAAPAGGAAAGATSAAPSAGAPSTSAPDGPGATTAAPGGTSRPATTPAATGRPSTSARRTTTSPRTSASSGSSSASSSGSGKGSGKGKGGGGSAATTSASGVVWPADVPFPAGTVQAHFDDPTDWSATLLSPGFQPDVHDRLTALYTGAGFTLVSDGLPAVLTRGRYTLRLQVSPRDHRENESFVTLQLSA